jgi:hypothetical protein
MGDMTMANPIYLVICGNAIPEYSPERELKDMTWDGTVNDIASMQFPGLARVIEIGSGKDVTKDMLKVVTDRWALQGEPLSSPQYDFVEQHCGTAFARKFELEAA